MAIYVGNKRYAPYIGAKRREVRNADVLIQDGLLLWFDGLNKGDSPSTTWTPVYSAITGFTLSTVGNPTVVDSGYVCSKAKLLQSTSNPFSANARNGYTLFFCISNADITSTQEDRALLSVNTPTSSNNNRGEFFVNNSHKLAIWFNGISTIESSIDITNNESGCFVFAGTASSSVFAKRVSDTFVIDSKNAGKIPSDSSNLVVAISNYLYKAQYNSGHVSGTYHSFVMYNRVLTNAEIEYVTKFLNKRYIQ